MSDIDVEVAVVGAGLTGAATAWALARRGVPVALIEAYPIGHSHGSSHGTSRIVRRVYDDPFYLRLTGRAFDSWSRAEDDTSTALVRLTGAVDHGAGRNVAALPPKLAAEGIVSTLMSAGEAAERWPGMRFEGQVLHHPQAGHVNADVAVAAFARRAGELGATILDNTRVTSIVPSGAGTRLHTVFDAGTRLHAASDAGTRLNTTSDAGTRLNTTFDAGTRLHTTSDAGTRRHTSSAGPVITAGTVVIAAGPWLPDLAPGLPLTLPALTVTQQQVFHFTRIDPSPDWPVFVYKNADTQIYGLPSGADGGPEPAFKVAQHNGGRPTTATSRDRVIDPASRDIVTRFVREFLPGLDPAPVAEASCLYTNTPDEDFILDRVGPLVIASPCSGHGAKFAALTGETAAALAIGDAAPDPRFALSRFR
ncbi:FAD-dependent oxidoreductase [Actinoplanes couchii]|uniref:N-methyltryptophan oxidase n=1 Tax=Actinoplanes couchii TaxID=403638 RepID=A0ABQ3XMG2_9ACTN|nr:FAD-dependent oxidoreductase [Actinoplanes couchii]MDR6321597.1 sarcosine oxidase [Actinoplanes couchii]GID59691.1 N-methyltryptophan oxidase [Actinoplanes couchii]